MRTRSMLCILRKDLSVGPRSPVVLFAITLPVILTVVLQLVFGTLFEGKPDLAYVDHGISGVIRELDVAQTVNLHRMDDEADLRSSVRAGFVDAGLILQDNFDEAVRAGLQPELRLYISGESTADARLVVTVSSMDAIRAVEGTGSPINLETIHLGSDDHIPLATRFVPVIAMYAFLVAGLFVPASSLVDERERGTLVALTITPASFGDVLVAKMLFGMILTVVMTLVTLWMNGALGNNASAMIAVILLTSVLWALTGIIVGLLAKSSQALFAIVKGSGALLMAPVVFYLFPDWPQWIARLFPTFWAIDPLWQIMANDAGFADVSSSVLVVLLMSVFMALGIARHAQRTG